MLENGFIKLHRSICNWEWYKDTNTFKLYIHLLLTVSIKESKFQGVVIPRGSRVAGISKLSEETGISVKSIRTAINHLERAGNVARSKYPKFTVITVNNYDRFQKAATKSASKGQSKGNQSASKGQQYKNIKEDIRKQEVYAAPAAENDSPPEPNWEFPKEVDF